MRAQVFKHAEAVAARRAGARRAGRARRSGSPPPRRRASLNAITPEAARRHLPHASRPPAPARRCRRHRHAAAARARSSRRRDGAHAAQEGAPHPRLPRRARSRAGLYLPALRMMAPAVRHIAPVARDRLVRRDGASRSRWPPATIDRRAHGPPSARRRTAGAGRPRALAGADRHRRPGRAAAQREASLRHVEELAAARAASTPTLLHRLATVLDALDYQRADPAVGGGQPHAAAGRRLSARDRRAVASLQDAAKKQRVRPHRPARHAARSDPTAPKART